MVTSKTSPAPLHEQERSKRLNLRPTWAEIDLGAVAANYAVLCSFLDRWQGPDTAVHGAHSRTPSSFPPRLIPVVKADAYGHGLIPVARALAAAGATAFAVAFLEEGITLREAGISAEVLVLEGAWPDQEKELIRHDLTTSVHSPENVRNLAREASRASRAARVHVKVDTGMSRLGVRWDSIGPLLEALGEARSLRLTGVFSHLACAEEEDSSFTHEQVRRFQLVLSQMRKLGLDPGEIHLANSAGLLYHPGLRNLSAPPGIALYGYQPAAGGEAVSLRPALVLKTRVGSIRTIQPGESAGYNRRFVASRKTRAAVLPAGYADGYRHGLTGAGKVIVRGRWAEVLGAVSMDVIIVDITDLDDVEEGDEVVLLGSTPGCTIDAAVWARLLGTIPYEILCGIGTRIPRVYLNGTIRSEGQGARSGLGRGH
jgi:alanine racemase